MALAPISPNLPLGQSYLIGQGPLHDQSTIDMVKRVGQHLADVVAYIQDDPAIWTRIHAHEPAALEAAQVGDLIGTFFLVAAGQAGGIGYYSPKGQASFVAACATCLNNQGALPVDAETMGNASDPWGAVNHRRIWYYAVDWSKASDADHYATAYVDPSHYGDFLTKGFVCVVQAGDGSWSLFRENGTTGFYRAVSGNTFEKDFSLDAWMKDNANTIYDAEIQTIGAILDIYTAGLATAAADIMMAMIKEAKPLLTAIASGNSAGIITSLADIAASLVNAAPEALAILKDAAPGTFAFVSTVGDDIKKAWEQTNHVLGGLVDSITDPDTFGPEMAVQAAKLAASGVMGGSLADRAGALMDGKSIAAIGGTITADYLDKARAAAGVGGFWYDHGWNVDLSPIKMIDTAEADYESKIDDAIRNAVATQMAAAPWYAKTYVSHGAVVSVMQAAQMGVLVPDPQLKGIKQVITAYQAGYIPPELLAATEQHITSATADAKNAALQDAKSRNVTPSATITVPGASTGSMVAVGATLATVAALAWYYFRKRRAA